MENTSPLLFDNTESKYFVASGGKAEGPLTAQALYEKIQRGEVGLLHYYWRKGMTDWKRLAEEKEFAVLVPKKPVSSSIKTLRARIGDITRDVELGPAAVSRPYYLYFNNTQYGPFSHDEMVRSLKTQHVGRNAYVWMAGWPNWKRMTSLPEFAGYLPPDIGQVEPIVKTSAKKSSGKTKSKITRAQKMRLVEPTMGVHMGTVAGEDLSDKRGGPRRPLVARLFLHNNQDVIIAVCRDISVGGMQVLTDRVPGPVGTRIRLNVSPGDPNQVKGFVAEGEIVRVLEDGRGFSFRFLKITEEAKIAIESYISN